MKFSGSTTFAIVASAVGAIALVAVPIRPEVPNIAFPSKLAVSASAPGSELAAEAPRVEGQELPVWGRDPFTFADRQPEPAPAIEPESQPQPAPEPVTLGRTPKLTGISLSDDGHLAILDRQLVRPGQELPSGYLVTNIDRTTVTLRRGDHEVTLNLQDER